MTPFDLFRIVIPCLLFLIVLYNYNKSNKKEIN